MKLKTHRSFFFRVLMLLTCLVLLPLCLVIILSMWMNTRAMNQELSHSMDTSMYYLETLSANTTDGAVKDIKAAFRESQVEKLLLAKNYADAVPLLLPTSNYCRSINKEEAICTDIGFLNANVGYIDADGFHNSISVLYQERMEWYRSSFANDQYAQYRYFLYQSEDRAYLVLIWPFISVKTHDSAIIYSIDLNSLFKQMEDQHVRIAVFSGDDSVYMGSEYSVTQEELANRSEIKLDGEYYRVHACKAFGDLCNVYLMIPYAGVSETQRWQQTTIWILIALCVLLTFLCALFVSSALYRPIRDLYSAARELSGDSVQSRLEDNEIAYVSSALEKAWQERKNAKDSLADQMRMYRHAQFMALQSQINPHFMYNTLDMIHWNAVGELGADNAVSEQIVNLSALMRISMESTSFVHDLGSELAHARSYVRLMNDMKNSSFEVDWQIETNRLDIVVPKIILQPILENAIRYVGGKILVTVECINGAIVFTVRDHGPGFDEEVIKRFSSEAGFELQQDTHIGLSNVYLRMKLQYGERCHFDLYNDQGAVVRIQIDPA